MRVRGGERKKINYILSWERLLLYPRTAIINKNSWLLWIFNYIATLSLFKNFLVLPPPSRNMPLTYNDVDIKWQVAFKSLENIKKSLEKWFFIVNEKIPILWDMKGWLYWLRITTVLERILSTYFMVNGISWWQSDTCVNEAKAKSDKE